jgi:eukaryotic-like serine/threonine-protein kinase
MLRARGIRIELEVHWRDRFGSLCAMSSDDPNDLTVNETTLPLSESDELRELAEMNRAPRARLSSRPTAAGDSGRYTETQRMLGAGGMGTISLVRDKKIGREVALKLMLDHDDTTARARFLREARIQACLEHPAIVPVYDMGEKDGGEPYFTMKRIRGQALSQVLRAQREGEPVAFSRRKLLGMLSQVAVAAHYAHQRGVVHRDIKPANIMLGPHGEVYLIDWGVAKVLGESEELGKAPTRGAIGATETEHGKVVGSLVTMAPEQITGDAVDARTDVYALGAVLFEILALQPLHPRGSVVDVAQAIIAGVEARPSVRTPEMNAPQELEELCVAATRRVSSERLDSALAFSQGLEAYLDSEHDEQLRRKNSEEHAAKGKLYAEQVLAVASSERSDSDGNESSLRGQALREVGRALALDATNKGALSTFVQLLTMPPHVVPDEVRGAQRASTSKIFQVAGSAMVAGNAAIVIFALLLYSMEVRDRQWIAEPLACFLASGIAGLVTRMRPSHLALFVSCLLSMTGCVFATKATSLTPALPALLVALTAAFSLVSSGRFRAGVLSFAVLCWTAMVYGPAWGLVPRTLRVSDGDIVLHSPAVVFDATWFSLWTFAAVLVLMVLISLIVGAMRSAFQRADDLQRLQAWQLRKLVADE